MKTTTQSTKIPAPRSVAGDPRGAWFGSHLPHVEAILGAFDDGIGGPRRLALGAALVRELETLYRRFAHQAARGRPGPIAGAFAAVAPEFEVGLSALSIATTDPTVGIRGLDVPAGLADAMLERPTPAFAALVGAHADYAIGLLRAVGAIAQIITQASGTPPRLDTFAEAWAMATALDYRDAQTRHDLIVAVRAHVPEPDFDRLDTYEESVR